MIAMGSMASCERSPGLVEIGVKLIVGAELSLARPGTRMDRSDPWRAPHRSSYGALRGKTAANSVSAEAATVALLASDHTGYTNLCRLLTHAHSGLPKGESLLEIEMLESHQEGLVAIAPGAHIPNSNEEEPIAHALLGTLSDIFGADRAFLAAFRRKDGLDGERLGDVLESSKRYGLGVIATARPLFHRRERKRLADVLHCIRTGTTLDEGGLALAANTEAVLCSDEHMRKSFRDHEDWVDRAGEVAASMGFSLSELRYDFPCELPPGESVDSVLEERVREGIVRRYPSGVPVGVASQIERELRLIATMNVAAYFLFDS